MYVWEGRVTIICRTGRDGYRRLHLQHFDVEALPVVYEDELYGFHL